MSGVKNEGCMETLTKRPPVFVKLRNYVWVRTGRLWRIEDFFHTLWTIYGQTHGENTQQQIFFMMLASNFAE